MKDRRKCQEGAYPAMLNTDIVDSRTSPSQEIMDKCINRLSSGLYNAATTSKQRIVNTDISEEVILPFINLLDECDVAMKRFLSGQTESDEWNAIQSIVLRENKLFNDTKNAKKWSTLLPRNDSKKISEVINWNGKVDYDSIADRNFPTSADLATQFLTKGDKHDPIDFSCIPNSQYNEILDSDITFDEIDDASRLLKEKSISDGWCPQMITSIKNTIFPVMIIIFNAILQCAFSPHEMVFNCCCCYF